MNKMKPKSAAYILSVIVAVICISVVAAPGKL
jgi:hypothetical protein